MEIERNVYVDLIFHMFAHMKIDNASDIYDEGYIACIENEIGKKTVIPEGMTEYYCANFERLAYINFLPYFMVTGVDELISMIRQSNITTEEDIKMFLDPFCDCIREISADYIAYRNRRADSQKAVLDNLKQYFEEQSKTMDRFFEEIYKTRNIGLKVLFSESLRCNGRAFFMGDVLVVILPVPSEEYTNVQLFMQLVHECTHMLTDPLLDEIRMDDGSHDISEYQVLLYDLWLFQRDHRELCSDYVEWQSKELLEACESILSDEQKEKLKRCFEHNEL